MKQMILAALLLSLAACASAPMSRQDRIAQVERSCRGETANQQGVAISPYAGSSSDYLMRECMAKHGVHPYQ